MLIHKLEQLIFEVHSFHGQPIYAGLESGISKKKVLYRVIFSLIRYGSSNIILNIFLVMGLILFYRHFRYPLAEKLIFEYGPTRNNISAFQRLNSCLSKELTDLIDLNGQPVSFAVRIRASMSIGRLWAAAFALQKNRNPCALPHIQAGIAVAAFLLYGEGRFPKNVKIVCVSSDHSPVAIAILFLARSAGVKTCYIQHAPVTEHFPPLKYDLSLLFDQSSVAAYARSAESRCVAFDQNIKILPPFSEEFKQPCISLPPYKIGVCLSSIPQIDRVRMLVKELSDHPSVSEVSLRCHPRFSVKIPGLDVAIQPHSQALVTFLDYIDILLVPTSGVAIEALHRGKPTFYVDGMDELPWDYYGFVAEGVLPVFNVNYLDDMMAIMDHFDASWRARFSKHDATVESPIALAQEGVAKAICALLEPD